MAGSASGSRPRSPAVPLPRSKPSCDGRFYHSSSTLSSSSPARYSHPHHLPQALRLRLTISLTSCMYSTWIPSCGLLFCQCQHAFVVISLLTYAVPTYFLTLPRRLIIRSTFLGLNCCRFRFSSLPRHGCKSVRLPAWTELSHPHCTR